MACSNSGHSPGQEVVGVGNEVGIEAVAWPGPFCCVILQFVQGLAWEQPA